MNGRRKEQGTPSQGPYPAVVSASTKRAESTTGSAIANDGLAIILEGVNLDPAPFGLHGLDRRPLPEQVLQQVGKGGGGERGRLVNRAPATRAQNRMARHQPPPPLLA